MRWAIDTIDAALRLRREGATRADVSRRLGVPVATVRTWERRGPPRAAMLAFEGEDVCAGCSDVHPEPDAAYAYLLGVYLGDGCLWRSTRSWSLRVSLDDAYPGIIAEVGAAIEATRGRPPTITTSRREAMVTVVSYWKTWPCLFPQHGPGRKHERPIVLEPWQRAIVAAHPGAFARGLIHTDGWRGLNRITVKGRAYAYPRYQFSNRSDDIRALFCEACDELGVAWRPWGRWHVSVARRKDVARLDEFVGPKA